MTENEIERRRLGAAGKLWAIEVLYYEDGTPSERRHVLQNQTSGETFNFRRNVFAVGIMLPIDPGHWKILLPTHIKEIHVYRQSKFFEP